jgi:hypothetical protein
MFCYEAYKSGNFTVAFVLVGTRTRPCLVVYSSTTCYMYATRVNLELLTNTHGLKLQQQQQQQQYGWRFEIEKELDSPLGETRTPMNDRSIERTSHTIISLVLARFEQPTVTRFLLLFLFIGGSIVGSCCHRLHQLGLQLFDSRRIFQQLRPLVGHEPEGQCQNGVQN